MNRDLDPVSSLMKIISYRDHLKLALGELFNAILAARL